jgi:drug/metabolite transporter (DMT)-like permease
MAAALALIAAALFALGSVLQQREAMQEPEQESGNATILLRLARHPVWLAGIATYAIAYGVQCVALGNGQLVVVQPILATTLVFALPLGAWLSEQRITRRDVLAAVMVTVGLGLFLVLSDPAGGKQSAPFAEWLLAGGIVLGAVALLTVAGMARHGAIRAALVGTAAGLTFGLLSGLTKEVVEVVEDGGLEVLGDWQLYAILGLGAIGMTLTQLSLQAGVLPPSIATSAIFNPALGILLGLILFDESIHRDAFDSIAAGLSLAAMFAGVALLALRPGQEPEPEPPPNP